MKYFLSAITEQTLNCFVEFVMSSFRPSSNTISRMTSVESAYIVDCNYIKYREGKEGE